MTLGVRTTAPADGDARADKAHALRPQGPREVLRRDIAAHAGFGAGPGLA